MPVPFDRRRYVLVTAAHNEEKYIERLLASVVSQTLAPQRWIVVSDGSTDRTDEIVETYARRHPFLTLYRIPGNHNGSFSSQVHAINLAFKELADLEYEYIGNLDADISLRPDYFAALIGKFEGDPALGLAGGMIHEERSGSFVYRKSNNVRSVAHGVQFFRRECLAAVGEYMPLRYGGPDWHAETVARMRGWKVQAFPELVVYHHRFTGTARGLTRNCYYQGLMDYSFGSYPLFEIVKCVRRIPNKPYVFGALVRLGGFIWGCCRREPRPVSAEFVHFLREEQRARLREIWRQIASLGTAAERRAAE